MNLMQEFGGDAVRIPPGQASVRLAEVAPDRQMSIIKGGIPGGVSL